VTEYSAVVFATLLSVRTADGRRVFMRKFAGGGYGSIDVVAYIDEQTVTPLIVLSTRTATQLTGALPDFVRSCGPTAMWRVAGRRGFRAVPRDLALHPMGAFGSSLCSHFMRPHAGELWR
jgi:hypothetical protein